MRGLDFTLASRREVVVHGYEFQIAFLCMCCSIALRILSLHYASKESEWSLMASKARVFLEAELEGSGRKAADLDAMLEKIEI